jgi:uncharacterized protein YutE (UPF0331/DUF86 family)
VVVVDKPLIRRKLERIELYLRQIRTKKDPGAEAFARDSDLQSIVMFNLIQAIQACTDMGAHIISDSGWDAPGTQAEIFEILAAQGIITKALAARMVRMVGFRNRIVHEYEKVDIKIVHTVWRKHAGDIERFCKAVLSYCKF